RPVGCHRGRARSHTTFGVRSCRRADHDRRTARGHRRCARTDAHELPPRPRRRHRGEPSAGREPRRRTGGQRVVSDYYELLSVSRNATADEIKSAYRRLARELRPDINPDDPAAHEQFKKLTVAYE